MLNAAFKALAQMFTPPFRGVLLKSVGLAIVLLIGLVIGLFRLLEWLGGAGQTWAEGTLGHSAHGPLAVLGWIVAFALGFGLLAGAILLMPAVTALVASFFGDEIAEMVERTHYPLDPPGVALSVPRAILEGVRIAALAIVIYLACAPFVLFAGLGVLMFFLANAYILGRQYFELAAMRFHPVAEAKAMRRRHGVTVLVAGLLIAGFVSIPIVNLATPLFGTAFMVHMHKRLMRARGPQLLEPTRGARS
jgi:CysZ protein